MQILHSSPVELLFLALLIGVYGGMFLWAYHLMQDAHEVSFLTSLKKMGYWGLTLFAVMFALIAVFVGVR